MGIGEESRRIMNYRIGLGFQKVIQVNQIRINVIQQIALKVGVQKYRTRPDKRLDESVARREFGIDVFYQAHRAREAR